MHICPFPSLSFCHCLFLIVTIRFLVLASKKKKFGVGAKSGVETIAHAVRIAYAFSDSGFVIWQNDARNAFNCVSRNAIREGLVDAFPQLIPIFDL